MQELKGLAQSLEKHDVKLVLSNKNKLSFKFTGDNKEDKKEAHRKVKALLPTIKKHKQQLIKVIDEIAYQRYVNKIQSESKFDPRRDLKEDSSLWQELLQVAYQENDKIYEIMHGYRCLGTRLKCIEGKIRIDKERTIKESDAFPDKKAWKRGLVKHIMPIQEELKEVLKKTTQKYNQNTTKAV